MECYFFETVNEFNWGKFMVGRFTGADFAVRSLVDDVTHQSLLRGRGWAVEHLFVFDIQTGEGAMFRPGGLPHADLEKHAIWVCPMFEPFLEWLYAQDTTHLDVLDRVIELPNAPRATRGYRRPGPPDVV